MTLLFEYPETFDELTKDERIRATKLTQQIKKPTKIKKQQYPFSHSFIVSNSDIYKITPHYLAKGTSN